jgi:hypothetical protein
MWTMVNDFRIEKSRLPIVLVTADGERISGDLFVQASNRRASGHESAIDVLNAPEPFFAIATMKGVTIALAKDRVRELFVAREDAEAPDWEYGTPADVHVVLHGGGEHAGRVLIQQATGHRRVIDFLNRYSDRFLPLYGPDGVVLVHRAMITYVQQTA